MARLLLDELCGGTRYYRYWLDISARRSRAFDSSLERALAVTLKEHIGTPQKPKPAKHRRGLVAEVIWRQLAREHVHPIGSRIFLSERDGVVTAGGPDGFVAYSDGTRPHWRLWEIKHSTQANGASAGTTAAYNQLTDRIDGYLSQIVIGRQKEPDPALRAMFLDLFTDWIGGSPHVGVGVAVATHRHRLPAVHFDTMNVVFPTLTTTGQLEGLLVGVGAYDTFVDEVCRKLWIRR